MDDSNGWRVWADTLVEAGDWRGELLHLELQGLDADTVTEECHAWLGDHDTPDDEVIERLLDASRLWRPVAAATGASLPALEVPPARWLSLVRPGEPSWGLHRCLLEAIVAVDGRIERAFDGVPAPSPPSATLRQAEAADSYLRLPREADVPERWQEVPDRDLLECQWALSHLDAAGLRHYVPAVMRFELRHLLAYHPEDSWITESLGYTLQPSRDNLMGFQRERLSGWTFEQRIATAAFCALTVNEPAAAAWLRAVEAGPKGDWVGRLQSRR